MPPSHHTPVSLRFVPGQRWVSLTEPELGLGLVMQVEARQVQVLFPGAGETRTYAAAQAPLKRVCFGPGDRVANHQGDTFLVESVDESAGLLTYEGAGHCLPEAGLADTLSMDGPATRLLSGHVDRVDQFELRLATLAHRARVCRSPVRGFTGARIDLLPHQIYIAHEVSRRQVPRVLLADEVGLGKTIEACLILHRLLVCGRVKRALILLPEALVHQWFVELLRRFNLSFHVLDETRCVTEEAEGSDNPFLGVQQALCSLDFLTGNPRRAAQARRAGWDLLIVDEAHHLRWTPDDPSDEYALVATFAEAVPGLLLLTASPEQSGVAGHFARLRLLDPQRYPDLDTFLAEHETYASVAAQAEDVIRSGDEAQLQDLLDRYGPGRVMFRNSRSAIAGFPQRMAHVVDVPPAGEGASDPRLAWLVPFLKDLTEKALIVCATSAEVCALQEVLRSETGLTIAAFHEQLPLLQCDRQAAWFAEPEGAHVLITSGMGGEGRNYQCASHMVLMDVPANPELVEQWIGRLDRIGQEQDVHIHVPCERGSRDAGRVRWMHEGLAAFSRPLVGGYPMFLRFGDRLGAVDDALIAETRRAHAALCREVEAGRDRLLELNSCRPGPAAGLVGEIRAFEESPALERYMARVFEQFGVEVEPLGDHDYLLKADQLFCEEFPLPRDQEGMRITYVREHALRRPTITLLSWDHPLVQGAMDLVVGTERGCCALGRCASQSGQSLQAVYVLEAPSSQRLAVERFLPPSPVIVTVDHALHAVAAAWPMDGDGEVWWLGEAGRVNRETLTAMVEATRALAETEAHKTRQAARAAMRAALGAEVRRLCDLRAINDHIQQEEIDAAVAQVDALTAAIEGARLRLDSLCLVVGQG